MVTVGDNTKDVNELSFAKIYGANTLVSEITSVKFKQLSNAWSPIDVIVDGKKISSIALH